MLTHLGVDSDTQDSTIAALAVAAPVFAGAAVFCAAAMGTGMLLAVVGNIMQTGFFIAPEAVMADPERINPLSHLKQMFKMEKVMELVTNLMKVIVIGACTVYAILGSFEQLVHMAQGPIERSADVFLGIVQRTERQALLALFIFAAVDWAVRKHFFMKEMMMEKQEVERERKDQYGDKHIRQHRRKMSRELMQGNVVQQTRKANAIVTNPTHFAVALRFHPDEAPLPVVLARGADTTAHLMIKIGREAGIPVVRSPRLARALYSVGREGRMIPSVTVKATGAVYAAILTVLEQGGEFDKVMEVDAD
jgi:type III secretion protein U